MASISNGNTPTLPEEVGKPPEGVVLPPKDIRGKFQLSAFSIEKKTITHICTAIVEKTAGYVARNGIVFEGELPNVPGAFPGLEN